jgi:hypothetical protein
LKNGGKTLLESSSESDRFMDRIKKLYDDAHGALSALIEKADHQAFDIALATVLANKMDGDAVATFVVASPSTAKTEYVMACEEVSWAYAQSKPSPKAFASGLRNGQDGAENSLLMRFNADGIHVLLFKEFASVLTLGGSSRDEVIGQLRDIADGHYFADFGTGVRIEWRGRLGMLAAVTPVIDRAWSAQRNMGDRWVFVRPTVPAGTKEREEIALAALDRSDDNEVLRKDLRDKVKLLVESVSLDAIPDMDEDQRKRLAANANFLAVIRTPIFREPQSKELQGGVNPEGPARLSKALYKLGRAVAGLRGHSQIEENDLAAIWRVVGDTAPQERMRVFVRCLSDDLSATDVASLENLSETSARRVLEELESLDLAICTIEPSGAVGRPLKRYRSVVG